MFLRPRVSGCVCERACFRGQLALLTQDIEDAFQERMAVLTLFIDLSKASGKVWKEELLVKILREGVCGKMHT